ncbi:alpha-2-macroglobulin [Taibaiella sp. KBW10]|uniref:alpha-2-macroglobulin family protein n=1 Tax=Taibaiella sp. KBW10 TaxID=2153357 RepID=UPI0013158051|nr:alpha-2-macroglobulin family protein [Taibaiella sp. KBW10]
MENIKALISYTNRKDIRIEIHRINASQFSQKDTTVNQIVQSTIQQLVHSEDFESHSIEINLGAYPIGFYAVVLSSDTQKLFHFFQVSHLLPVSINRSKHYIVNRKTGFPEQQVTVWYRINTPKIAYQYLGISNPSGHTILRAQKGNLNNYTKKGHLIFTQNRDTLLLDDDNQYDFAYTKQYKQPRENHEQNGQKVTHFLFTDRSIYRPGQSIHYKGIVIQSKYNLTDAKVLSKKKVTVEFNDVNGQTIATQTAITNEFGSFAGTFIAPETGLLGEMEISTEETDHEISVEEYKRPKFYIEFDTIRQHIGMNTWVSLRGQAKAYAGNPISNAEVTYTVGRCDGYSKYYNQNRYYEIFDSVAKTDSAGYFNIRFITMGDKNDEQESTFVFAYEINAEITDINGETRSKTAYVKAAYVDRYIYNNVPGTIRTDQPQKMHVGSYNINETFTPTQVKVTIKQLKKADRLYRYRLWDAPTDTLMSRTDFQKHFPNDAYGLEGELQNREITATVWDTTYTTGEQQFLILDTAIWPSSSGYYLIETRAQDNLGKKLIDKKYVFVLDPANPQQYDIPIVTYHNKYKYQPGDTVYSFVYPAVTDISLFQNNSWNKTYNWKNGHTITQKISERDRGTGSLNWMYIYNGRIYATTDYLFIPWSNKNLNISIKTQRDKLYPNTKEEWTITVEDYNNKRVKTEVLASMYDASLDELKEHNWAYEKMFQSVHSNYYWGAALIQKEQHKRYINVRNKIIYQKVYPQFRYLINDPNHYEVILFDEMNSTMLKDVFVNAAKLDKRTYTGSINTVHSEEYLPAPALLFNDSNKVSKEVNPRSNFKETAFFIPQLQTDTTGKAVLKFTVPESLTEWRLMVFAHTKDWGTGYSEQKIQTQKELMVSPNMPRLFRQGDEMVIAAKISNQTNVVMHGKVSIEIRDAQTQQLLNLPFSIQTNAKDVIIPAKQSTNVSFNIKIPQSIYTHVSVQITATAGDFSDGERHVIPVFSNRILVTEALPMSIPAHKKSGEFNFDHLIRYTDSSQITSKRLMIEYTTNPSWYVLTALPYLIEYPYECTEQKFNKLFSNALALNIVENTPAVDSILHQWIKAADIQHSVLAQNNELKTTLLTETPWVLEAQNEQEQQKQLARLLDTKRTKGEIRKLLKELKDLQQANGAFSWFSGMPENLYITQYLLTGIARLKELNIQLPDTQALHLIIKRGISFLDEMINKTYIQQQKNKTPHLDAQIIQYLYVRSLYPEVKMKDSVKLITNYFLNIAKTQWPTYTNYLQGMMALTFNKMQEQTTAHLLLESLSERAVKNEDMGMYWPKKQGYYWYEDPIATQALLINAYTEIKQDTETVSQLKTWLFKQKQAQHWGTTTATAEACYALLKSGSDWTENQVRVKISLGDTIIQSPAENPFGYLKTSIDGSAIKPEMGHIKVNLLNHQKDYKGIISWGAIYWQYYDNLNSIKATQETNPLQIERKLYLLSNTIEEAELSPIEEQQELNIGDKIMIRLIIHADRDMEYIHLKDMRASGFEPLSILSTYKYQGGLGYYENTRDASTNFFFDRIPKGTWVLSYPVIVNQKGSFTTGITTIQCMYAPEFGSHTNSQLIKIK